MKYSSRDLKKHTEKTISYEKNTELNLWRNQSYQEQNICYICKRELNIYDKEYYKIRDHCHYTGKCKGAAHNVYNIRYKIPKWIPVAFHKESKYDYHFIIKDLAEEFESQIECLTENTEKYMTFSVTIKKLENNKTITYKIKFIDSFRFMSSSLSCLVDNLAEGLHDDKCTDSKYYLEYKSTKDELIIFNGLKCSKNHKKHFNKNLIKRFAKTYECFNGDINNFFLVLIKVVYLYQYMDSWKIGIHGRHYRCWL